MPPVISIFLSAFFYELFFLTMGKPGWIFFAGFVAGYSTYLIIHYAVHSLRPPDNFLKYLWKHHSLHHYSSVNTAYSVSFPLWDILFGTMPAKNTERKAAGEKLPDAV
jgi:sterol desaturase/sphingolipid hydroxylase (fatty acid hydroxylase superfamily)